MAAPVSHCPADVLDGGVRVANGGQNAVLYAVPRKLAGAGQFRRGSPARDATVGIVDQFLIVARIRRGNEPQIHAARALQREVGPFKMHAEQALPAGALCPGPAEGVQRAVVFFPAGGDRGGQDGRYAVQQVHFTGAGVCLRGPVHEIIAACPVCVHFNQPRGGIQRPAVDDNVRLHFILGRQLCEHLAALQQQGARADGAIDNFYVPNDRSVHGFPRCQVVL